MVRLHSSLYPPLDQSLILVFARLIHSSSVEMVLGIVAGLGRIQAQQKELERIKQKATDQYASFSRTVLKPVEVDALPYLISKWITTLSDRMARYSSKILHLALIKLMTYIFTPSAPGSDMLRNLECQGYIIPAKPEPKKRPHTRQTTAASGNSSSHEPSYTRIPLSTKLLSMFLKEWSDWSARHAVQMKAKARKARRLAREAGEDVPEEEEEDEEDEYFEDDEDGEFDDDDDDEDDSEWIKQMHGKMSGGAGKSPFAAAEDFQDMGRGALAGNSKLMTLSDLLDAHDEFQFDGETEEELHPESLTDPLNEIQLGPYVQSFVKEFGQAQNGAMLHEAGRYLDQKDQEMLQALMNAQQPATPQK